MLLDVRLWLLIGLSIAMLFTIEVVEDFAEGDWPQLRRPANGWGSSTGTRTLWVTVAMVMLPGLVLALGNLAILVWRGLPYSGTQIIGSIFVVIGWLGFLAMVSNLAGIGSYVEGTGFVTPVALVVVLVLGDVLLLVSLIDILPTNLGEFLPVGIGG